jgi:predicted RNA-binding protein with PIN domain
MAPRREFLIDAYNVMFAHPQLGPLLRRDLERAREEFLALVAMRIPADGTLGVVVFDATRDPRPVTEVGRTGGGKQRGLQVVFARDSADAWIQKRIRDHEDASCLTIVTSDREILATARAHGAGITRVSEFLQLAARRNARTRALRDREKPEHSSQREIDEWKKLFEKPRDEE